MDSAASSLPYLPPAVWATIDAGEYGAALRLLLEVEARGGMDAAYNNLLAAVAMRAGEYAQATLALERLVLQQPENAGAWLDLAIASTELGDSAAALSALDYLEGRFNPPPAIRAVTADLRRRLDLRTTRTQTRLRAALIMGRDSNANSGLSREQLSITSGGASISLPVDPAYRSRPDNVALATLDWAGSHATGSGQWEWRAALHDKHYFSLSENDEREGVVSLGYAWPWGSGVATLTGEWRRFDFGGSPLVRAPRLRAGYQSPALANRCRSSFALEAEWRRYDELVDYDGNLAWLESGLRCKVAEGLLSGILRLSEDAAQGGRPGGDTRRAELTLVWQRPLAGGRQLDLAALAYFSRDAEGYSPELADNARRNARRLTLYAEMSWPLDGPWRVVASAEASRQVSNIDLFDQDDAMLLAGVRYSK